MVVAVFGADGVAVRHVRCAGCGPWLRGLTNDVYFQIGLVTLLGLAAKNAILIVEYASLKASEGYSTAAAAIEAARLRFRPIVMTSLAFILGVVPLAFSTGAGAGARVSAGTGVMGGMLAATFLAIFFVPLFFKLITDRKLRETRSAEELHAEVAEGERRSAEKHAKLAAEAATHVHVRKGGRKPSSKKHTREASNEGRHDEPCQDCRCRCRHCVDGVRDD